MKKIFKYFGSAILVALLVFSCEVSNFDLQENPNQLSPESSNPEFLLNEMQFLFENILSDLSISTDDVMRYEALTNSYNGVVNVEVLNREWDFFYRALRISNTVEELANEDSNLLFHNAVNKLLMGYLTVTMVDYVGDIPYTEAASPEEFLSPRVEGGANLYNIVLADIDQAIVDINASNFIFNDLFYGGDKEKWVAFANSFKLRMLVQARLSGASLQVGDISAAINSVLAQPLIQDIADDFQFSYASVLLPESRSNYFRRGYISGFTQYIGNYFMWMLRDSKSVRDPRIRYYIYRQSNDDPFQDPPVFLLCQDDPAVDFCYIGEGYWGLDHGEGRTGRGDDFLRSTYGIYPGGGKFDEDDFTSASSQDLSSSNNLAGAGILPLLTSSYVKFLQAEAALTLGTNGSPDMLLEEAIRQSMEKVMGFGGVSSSFAPSATDVDDYVNAVMTNYAGATNDAERLDIIVTEYYLASFGNSIESYNAYRRTGFPSNIQTPIDNDNPDFPRSFPYPNEAVISNTSLTQKLNSVQVFWDTNPSGFIK